MAIEKSKRKKDENNLVGKLGDKEKLIGRVNLVCVCPDGGKYAAASAELGEYLSPAAEWMGCAQVQKVLLDTRVQFGKAEQIHADRVTGALGAIDPLNMSLIEAEITKHDQLAVIEEIGRFVPAETKALLHPGTTSYDILDTARSYLLKGAWNKVMAPNIKKSISKLCDLADESIDILQVGRTHLQDTSPVLFGGVLAGYAARLAERFGKCDAFFNDLRGKVSGIVGTGASIDMVIGEGKGLEFEKAVLKKLNLEPDYTATQVVQKERLSDVGHGLTSMMYVLKDFANDVRLMYSSAIKEVTSRDNAERLGGSSADATKNNPINWENMIGKATLVESGMRVLYEMIQTDFQRDLTSSVQARYQPQGMMVQTHEAFSRLNKTLKQFSINEDKIRDNLEPVRKSPSEAMVAILRGEQWVHPKYGVGHAFVKEMGKIAKKTGAGIYEVASRDCEFVKLYNNLSENKQAILKGTLENYLGSARDRAEMNLDFAMSVVSKGN